MGRAGFVEEDWQKERELIEYTRVWKGGRVVEGTALEKRHTGNGIESSNLSLSALNLKLKLMTHDELINKTVEFVKRTLKNAEGGHDWWHIFHVWKNSKRIGETEKVDMLVVELGALLHDIADSKFYNGDEEIGPRKAREFLESLAVDESTIDHIENIIRNISFRGGNHEQFFKSPELDVIQDADRLEALGAIGIARVFNFGGYKGRPIYRPEIQPNLGMDKEEFKKSMTHTINHFYEKLLLLKDRMNTNEGKRLAEHRHQYMEEFLKEFYGEWEGKF